MSTHVKPRRAKEPWGWRDPVYRHNYLLFVCPAPQMTTWIKAVYKRDLDMDAQAVAYTLHIPENVIGLWFNSERCASAAEWAAYVAHEAEHATRFVLDGVGMPHNAESDEAWAYYLCWIVEEITSRLRFRHER
jgi:hypothetical protein